MTQKTQVYVGTYTHPIKFGTGQILDSKGKGIYRLELDLESGNLEITGVSSGIINPSYLVIDQSKRFLYAVNELKEYEGKASGSVSAFKISEADGTLKLINMQPTNGTDPCHVILSPEGKHLFVSNYMSGSVAVYPIQEDGAIGEMCQFFQHEGSSVNPARQTGPHAHALVFSPDGRFAFVPDLGIDRLMIYQMTGGDEPLRPAATPYFQTRPGAGPRHCVFSQDGQYCYLINELNSTISVLAYDSANGSFSEVQVASSLPEGLNMPGNTCADIHLAPDGNYLYGSNRGNNSLVVYRVEKETGKLTYIDCQPCGGEIPRNFAIDPSGRYLLCANQDSDNIVTFGIDKDSGRLTKLTEITVHTPVCVKMIA